MATDATATPTPLGIPKFAVGVDAPTGNGSNAQMDAIDTLIAARVVVPTGIATGDVPVWSGSGWVKPGGTRDGTKFLRDDGVWAAPGSGGVTQIARTTNPGSVYDTNTVLGGTLPTTYSSLFITYTAKSDQGGFPHSLNIRFNNDSTANYDWQGSYTTSTTPTGEEAQAASAARVSLLEGTLNGASLNTRGRVEIPDYRETNLQKGYVCTSGTKYGTASGQMAVGTYCGFWRSTVAITRIQLFPDAGNFDANSIITLYGVT